MQAGKREVVAVEKVGELEGYVYLISDLSLYNQTAIPRKKLGRHMYLCVQLDKIEHVPAGLHSNVILCAEWREYVLTSQVRLFSKFSRTKFI
jgi:hypothetical protein